MAEVSLAGSVGSGGQGREQLASTSRKERGDNVLEDVTLSDDVGAGLDVESMSGVL